MDKEVSKIKKQILKFLKKIKEFKIEKAIIFGSRIRGDYLEESDIDLILVSDDFKNIPFTDRMGKVYTYYNAKELKVPLELICYTKKEFQHKSKIPGLVQDALKEGIIIDLG
jgi:hypothetical protein